MFPLKFRTLLSLTLYASSSFCSLVHFDIDLTWETRAPDGNARQMILTNGQFPGPTLELDYGDEVEFVVTNHLPFETAVHFHGIEQSGTPWSDGVPGVSQKPIALGATFTYKWRATQYGTYWYHGHARSQIQDGLYGPIVIRPASSEPSPFTSITQDGDSLAAMKRAEASPKVAMLSDWDHLTSEEYMNAEQVSGLDIFCMDSLLINGKGAVNCQPQELLNQLTPPPLAKLLNGSTISDKGCTPPIASALTQGNFTSQISQVPPGLLSGCVATKGTTEIIQVDAADTWMSINFISAMSSKSPVVSIDEHPMWVYAVDGQYIEPQQADTIFLYNGERYSAMVKLDKPPGDYTIRVANLGPDQQISGYATLSYRNGNSNHKSIPYINYGGSNVSASVFALDETKLKPFPAVKPAPTADSTYILNLGRLGANYMWTLNGNASYPLTNDDTTPLLLNPNSPTAHNPNLVLRTRNGTWVDIILQVALSPSAPAQPAHPVHKHSNKAFIIGSSTGVFNWTSVAEAAAASPQSFNLETPQLRDSFVTPSILQGPAWVALRYQVVNPGAFFLHCHIQTHLAGGMAMVILDGVDAWPEVPGEYAGLTR